MNGKKQNQELQSKRQIGYFTKVYVNHSAASELHLTFTQLKLHSRLGNRSLQVLLKTSVVTCYSCNIDRVLFV